MGWEQAIKSEELFRIERKKGDSKVIIEARKSSQGWDVFKTHVSPKCDGFVEDYTVKTFDEAKHLIEELKKEKELSKSEIEELNQTRNQELNIDITREYKEKNVEKWNFSLNNDKIQNSVILRFSNSSVVDIMLHNLYRHYEDKVLDKLVDKLGLDEYDGITFNVYFFSKTSNYDYDCADDLIANVEFGFKQ